MNTLLTNVNNLQNSVTVFHNEFTANVIVVNNKLDAANTKLDDLAIVVSDEGALNLRIHIEDDLADPGNHPLALFEVPEANGGQTARQRRSRLLTSNAEEPSPGGFSASAELT